MLANERQVQLERYVLGGGGGAESAPLASASGSNMQSNCLIVQNNSRNGGGGCMTTTTATTRGSSPLSMETLIDAFLALYDECLQSSLRRDKTLTSFVDYAREYAERLRELRLTRNDFDLVKVIGRGAFGEVAFVRMKHTENIYAMKILNKWEILKRAEVGCYVLLYLVKEIT
jgi:hypothetical protein